MSVLEGSRDYAQVTAARNCEDVLYTLLFAIDGFDYDTVLKLFVDDLQFVANKDEIRSKAKLMEWLQKRPPSRVTKHICSNIRFTCVGVQEADCDALITLYALEKSADGSMPSLEGASAIAQVSARFVTTLNGWKIQNYRVGLEMIAA